MSLPTVIQAILQGRTVRVAHLVEFCFLTQSRRLWNGSFELVTSDDHHWFGLRKLGQIEGLEEAGALESAEMRFSVSGVDSRFLELFTLAAAESKAEYVNRHVKVFYQFFDADWQILDAPVACAAGLMDNIGVDAQPVAGGGTQRIISITAQNIFHGRGRPPASFYTMRDQMNRSDGDRGLEHIYELIETNIETPW